MPVEQSTHCLRIALAERRVDPLVEVALIGGLIGDVLLQCSPARESVLPGKHELRVGERNARLVREDGADASRGLGVAGAERFQQLLRLLLLLLQVRMGGERTTERGRHGTPPS
jgi:hypothetical protein